MVPAGEKTSESEFDAGKRNGEQNYFKEGRDLRIAIRCRTRK